MARILFNLHSSIIITKYPRAATPRSCRNVRFSNLHARAHVSGELKGEASGPSFYDLHLASLYFQQKGKSCCSSFLALAIPSSVLGLLASAEEGGAQRELLLLF
jgi:hypothetical protein